MSRTTPHHILSGSRPHNCLVTYLYLSGMSSPRRWWGRWTQPWWRWVSYQSRLQLSWSIRWRATRKTQQFPPALCLPIPTPLLIFTRRRSMLLFQVFLATMTTLPKELFQCGNIGTYLRLTGSKEVPRQVWRSICREKSWSKNRWLALKALTNYLQYLKNINLFLSRCRPLKASAKQWRPWRPRFLARPPVWTSPCWKPRLSVNGFLELQSIMLSFIVGCAKVRNAT